MEYFTFNLKKLTISNRSQTLTIEGISFELDQDEPSLAIVGESGMGKTTIFKSLFPKYISIWSVETPFDFICEHFIGQDKVTDETIKSGNITHKIGFATQVPYFFNSQSVKENLFGPLRWKNILWTKKQEKEYVNVFNLEKLVDKQMSILSGGQRQLVNIARMFVINPSIAIIDECFSNMDEEMAQKYIDIIKNRFPDCFILLTSHRKADIDYFNCKTIKLRKKLYRSGKSYITQIEP